MCYALARNEVLKAPAIARSCSRTSSLLRDILQGSQILLRSPRSPSNVGRTSRLRRRSSFAFPKVAAIVTALVLVVRA